MPEHAAVSIAYFITPHGFGHASRAAAVMAALKARLSAIRFELFTTAPRRIFEDTLGPSFAYHPLAVDIGMVQLSPLQADLKATIKALDRLLPFKTSLIDRLASLLQTTGCRLVVCDIAALGIAAAQQAGLPSVLVENFTWDWIYQGYADQEPGLQRHVDYLRDLYGRADLRLQTKPICLALPGKPQLNPICRRPRSQPDAVRRRLGVPPRTKMVLVSMGGVPDEFAFLRQLPPTPGIVLVIPGAPALSQVGENIIPLPAHSRFYQPDLMHAADALIGKAGYSTVAEACQAGIPFGYVNRTDSPESPVLEAFISANLPCCPISAQDYVSGQWIEVLPRLLAMPRYSHHPADGAQAAAGHIISRLIQIDL
jgi:UDP:flavonoid glycosyltransferase YjiC (YdhE family)